MGVRKILETKITFKITDFGGLVPFDRPNTIDFLSVFHCSYVSILHRFRDIISHFSKLQRSHVTLNTSASGVIYHSLLLSMIVSISTHKCLASSISKI